MTVLKKAVDGPLKGFTYVPVDLTLFAKNKQAAYDAHVQYVFGSKDQNVGSGAIDYTGIDCSGFVRTLLDYATHQVLKYAGFPDGSYTQAQWLIDQGFKNHKITSAQDYLDAVDLQDDFIRACFHYPNGRSGDSTGHVWITTHQHTTESFGGHGPGEHPIDNAWECGHCDLVVVLGPLVGTWSY